MQDDDDFLFDDPLSNSLPPLPGNMGGNSLNQDSSFPPNDQDKKPTRSRMDILNSLYDTIFGRVPDSNAVMYYMGLREINEDSIRQQMVESAEHRKILEDAKQLPNLQTDLNQAKSQASLSERATNDKKMEIEHLNSLLKEKNNEILELRHQIGLLKRDLKHLSGNPVTTESSGFIQNLLKSLIKLVQKD